MGAESERVAGFGRLEDGLRQAGAWYRWGPYVSERQWGTVREDYSANGEAWDYLPHDHARSHAYRWGEDGLAGFCDIEQRLCLGLALWNGRDPILKERAFGLTGSQGNHGEDVKEYWWYLDAVPSHAWNRWRYHYPQAAYPYQDLINQNAWRNRYQPEYELVDTGTFDAGRYWIVEVHYAKADPDDVLMKISVTNAGPEADTLHVLPTAWFRNTWSWEIDAAKPAMAATGDTSVGIEHPWLGSLELLADAGPDGAAPTALFCENETNTKRLYGVGPITPYPKDGINDHVISGAATVNPGRTGTKCAFWYQVTVAPDQTAELRLRLRPTSGGAGRGGAGRGQAADAFGAGFDRVMAQRQAEADEFYAELTPRDASADEAMVMRQAFGGLLWSKQLFYYDVERWLDGDPTQPVPPHQRQTGRNSRWRNFDAFDIMSMPDKWEYPCMFGGNSNWRGPIWFPLNYLMVSVLERYHRFYGDDYTIEYPTGSGQLLTLDKVAADLAGRLISIFTNGPDGRRPCFGGTELMQTNPAWHDNLIFSEYFHGDNGAAIGAFHQTGWTGVIADLIRRRHGDVEAIGDVFRRLGAEAGR
jgi:hypothetical protein